jgi:hypothetical protein
MIKNLLTSEKREYQTQNKNNLLMFLKFNHIFDKELHCFCSAHFFSQLSSLNFHPLVSNSADPMDGTIFSSRLLPVPLELDSFAAWVLVVMGRSLLGAKLLETRAPPLHILFQLHVLNDRKVPVVDSSRSAVTGEVDGQQTTHMGGS